MEPLKLNLGSGHKRLDGYINLDDDPLVSPDYMVNLNQDKLPFEDNSVSEVLASHILEHIGQGYIPLMKEIYRVCGDNAMVHITVPHPRSDWYADDPTHVRPITSNSFRLFSKKYIRAHIESYGSSNGIALKENIDFEVVDVKMSPFPKWAHRFETMSPEEIAEVADSQYNVFYEVYVCLVVIKE